MRRLMWVLMLCVALAGCGKSTEEKYKEGFPPIDRGLVVLGADLAEGLRNGDDRALAARFAGYGRRIAGLRDRLEGLEPPDRLSKDHAALLAATAAVRAALADVAQAARRDDPTAAGAAATRLVREETRLEEIRGELARAVRTG